MEKGLVLYKSKYGSAKKYAEIMKAETQCDVRDIKEEKDFAVDSYDWIVYAGGLYGGGIAGLGLFRKKYHLMKNKKTAIFCVGASPYDEKAFEEMKKNILKEELKDVSVFYGRGAWDESKMSWKDRTLCKMLQRAIAKKDPENCEPWMKALLSSMGKKCDWVDRKYLIPLIDYIDTK